MTGTLAKILSKFAHSPHKSGSGQHFLLENNIFLNESKDVFIIGTKRVSGLH